jgi:3-oxoacyl-[acyl-carrier protein] reductase
MSRICLVTGASRGIGRCVAQQLAAKGATVVVNFTNNKAAADEALALLDTRGGTLRHTTIQADVANPDECKRLLDDVVRMYGRLDVLVNNAGICKDHDIMTVSYDEWQRSVRETMDTNYSGAANLSFLAVRQFAAQDAANGMRAGGRIVNVTSRAAYRGELTAPAYASSKAALNIFGQSLARRLAEQRILVYSVAPGWVETEMAQAVVNGPQAAEVLAQHPLGRIAKPEEVGQEVAYLSLEAPEAMTGCVIDINGASYLR